MNAQLTYLFIYFENTRPFINVTIILCFKQILYCDVTNYTSPLSPVLCQIWTFRRATLICICLSWQTSKLLKALVTHIKFTLRERALFGAIAKDKKCGIEETSLP